MFNQVAPSKYYILVVLAYRRFCYKMSKGTSHVEPRTLPPSSEAALYRSLRVFYHVMYWKGKCDSMKPEEWGWHIVDVKCLPIQTDKPAAPAELLDITSCSCKKL